MPDNTPVSEDIRFAKGEAAKSLEKVIIESDGTIGGTSIKVNGKAISNLYAFNFGAYFDGYSCPISLSFSTREKEVKAGEFSAITYFQLKPKPDNSGATAAVAHATIEHSHMQLPSVTPRNLKAMYAQM